MMTLRIEDKTKEEFLKTLAHELRNPLAAILSTVELIRAQRTNAKDTPELLDSVEKEVRQMATMLDNLLIDSRISGNKFKNG